MPSQEVIHLDAYKQEMERRLQESEARYRLLAENVQDVIWTMNLDLTFTYFSPSVTRLTGYAPDQALTKTLAELLTPASLEEALRVFYQELEENRRTPQPEHSWGVHWEVVRRDGSVIWTESRMSFLRDSGGRATGIVGVTRDISRRRQVEQALLQALGDAQQHRSETQTLLEASQAVLQNAPFDTTARAIFDFCKKLIGATSGYVALLNQTTQENEVLFLDSGGRSCTVAPDLPMPIRGLRAEAYSRGEPVYDNDFSRSPWQQFMPPGHVRLDNVLFAPLMVQGRALGLLGLANKPGGFTERDRERIAFFGDLAAVALQNSQYLTVLAQTEERFRAVMASAPDAILIVDPEGRLISWNPQAEALLGYEGIDLEGLTFPDLFPESQRQPLQSHLDLLFSGPPHPLVRHLPDLEVRRRDGATVPVDLSLASWQSRAGTFLTVILRDNAPRFRAEAALRQSDERYRQVFENAPLGIMHFDGRGVITALNDTFADIIGAPREQITGFRMQEQLRDERMRDAVTASLCGETGYYEGDYLSETGNKLTPVRAWFRGILSPSGEFLGGVSIFEDNTPRQRAEAARQEQLHFLRTLLDAIPNPIFYKDTDGVFLGCNQAFADFLGRPQDAIRGKTVHELYPPYLAEFYSAKDAELFRQPGVQLYETRMPRTDAVLRQVMLHTATYTKMDGTVAGLIGVLVDITEHKWTEAILREHRLRLQLALDAAGAGTWTWNLQTGEVYWDDRAQRLFGLEPGAFDGTFQAWKELVHPEDREEAERQILQAVTEARAYNFTYRVQGPGGNLRILNSQAIVIRDKDDLPLRMAGLVVDVTARQQAAEALREIERQRRAILDTIPDMAWLKDEQGRYIMVNQAFLREAHLRAEEVLGRRAAPSWGPMLAQRFIVEDHQVMASGRPLRLEDRIVKDSGEEIWFETIKTPIFNDQGQVCGVTGVSRNITDRVKAEKVRQTLENQLFQAQKMQAIGTLASGIAHDFNNILGVIIGYAEMLEMFSEVNDPVEQENLGQILQAAHRAQDLVRQILTFTRQEEQERRIIQLSPVIKETSKFLRASLPTTITIQTAIDSDSSILANPTQMQQILMNLCTNAGYVMRDRGGRLEITLDDVIVSDPADLGLTSLVPGLYQRLTVTDSGPGMPSEVVGRVFEPYFTTKPAGEGTGLGLAVVHGIVTAHGGDITVSSQPGQGTSFTVYLPRHQEGGLIPESELPADLPRGTETILLVDDEPALVEVGRTALESLGYWVCGQTSSLQALQLFQNDPRAFDLVITDLTMPELAGLDFVKEILNLRPNMPIILCTGHSERYTLADARRLGICQFLTKPLGVRRLAEVVRQVLDDRTA